MSAYCMKRKIVKKMATTITDSEETAAVFTENTANVMRNESEFGCMICNKTFKTDRGLNQHIRRSCSTKTNKITTILSASQPIPINRNDDSVRNININAINKVNDENMLTNERNEFINGNVEDFV